jgi:hypothetical protein
MNKNRNFIEPLSKGKMLQKFKYEIFKIKIKDYIWFTVYNRFIYVIHDKPTYHINIIRVLID